MKKIWIKAIKKFGFFKAISWMNKKKAIFNGFSAKEMCHTESGKKAVFNLLNKDD